MTEFKVGDKVRVAEANSQGSLRKGDVAVVAETDWPALVVEHGGKKKIIAPGRVEKIEPEPEYKSGDRVRVTFEAQFHDETEDWVQCVGASVWKTWDDVDILNVEKVEPPVETFKAGDVVRMKPNGNFKPRWAFLLTATGYVTINDGGCWHHESEREFTSKRFEKVDLAEVPF